MKIFVFTSLLVMLFATVSIGQDKGGQDKGAQDKNKQDENKQDENKQDNGKAASESEVPAALDFTMKSIDGDDVALKDFHGKVVVVVNVASKCGLTPQYKGLQELHDEHADDGLVILGFPCDQFRNQEYGTDAEIKRFCTEKYGIEFPMFSKVDVNGDDRCDLYKYLSELETEPAEKGDITWNFEKFVIDREGNVVGRYSPRVKPDSDDFVEAVKNELDKKSSQ